MRGEGGRGSSLPRSSWVIIDDGRVAQFASHGRNGRGGEEGRKDEKFELHFDYSEVSEREDRWVIKS
jgi:hypothetical protein